MHVTSIKRGQFVIGSFAASDNTCPHCRAGYHSSCAHREWITARRRRLRVPMADGTLSLRRRSLRRTSSPAFWRFPTCWALAGSPLMPRM